MVEHQPVGTPLPVPVPPSRWKRRIVYISGSLLWVATIFVLAYFNGNMSKQLAQTREKKRLLSEEYASLGYQSEMLQQDYNELNQKFTELKAVHFRIQKEQSILNQAKKTLLEERDSLSSQLKRVQVEKQSMADEKKRLSAVIEQLTRQNNLLLSQRDAIQGQLVTEKALRKVTEKEDKTRTELKK